MLELALRETLSLGHNYIGTEHILLGLVRENEGVAARILLDFDADSDKIRNEVIRMLSGPGGRRLRPGSGGVPPRQLKPGEGSGKKSLEAARPVRPQPDRSSPPTASWIPSSGARPRSSGSCRSFRAAPKNNPS